MIMTLKMRTRNEENRSLYHRYTESLVRKYQSESKILPTHRQHQLTPTITPLGSTKPGQQHHQHQNQCQQHKFFAVTQYSATPQIEFTTPILPGRPLPTTKHRFRASPTQSVSEYDVAPLDASRSRVMDSGMYCWGSSRG